MSRDDILAQVADIIREYFDEDGLEITDATSAADVEGWDSLSHVNIMAAIEQKFRTKISVGEFEKIKNIGDLVTLLGAKVA